MDLYFFDVQNPDGILNGERPVVVELGPYSYNEYYKKLDVSWSDDGDTVQYIGRQYFEFAPERTGLGLTEFDNLTLPYPTVLGLQYLLNQIPLNVSVLVDTLVEVRSACLLLTIV